MESRPAPSAWERTCMAAVDVRGRSPPVTENQGVGSSILPWATVEAQPQQRVAARSPDSLKAPNCASMCLKHLRGRGADRWGISTSGEIASGSPTETGGPGSGFGDPLEGRDSKRLRSFTALKERRMEPLGAILYCFHWADWEAREVFSAQPRRLRSSGMS